MRLAKTCGADDHASDGFIVGFWMARIGEKISYQVFQDVLMYCWGVIWLIAPNALELAGPVEIDRAKCVKLFDHHLEIQMICLGSLPICRAAPRSASVTSVRLSSCISDASSSRCIRLSAVSSS